MKRFRDPVYGYIEVPDELVAIVESLFLARLRGISQNGRAQAAYPSLNGTRYEHALGTMHLAMQAWDSAWSNTSSDETRNKYQVQTDFAAATFAYLSTAEEQFSDGVLTSIREENLTYPQFLEKFPSLIRMVVGAVGLLHDVGHAPFSHTLERPFSSHREKIFSPRALDQLSEAETRNPHVQFHEACGIVLVREVLTNLSFPGDLSTHLVWETYQATSHERLGVNDWASCLHGIVAGELDVDRIDYLARDSHRSGTEFGAIDIQRLLNGISLHATPNSPNGSWNVGYDVRAVSAVESLMTNRERAYRWVYFHPHSLLADTALIRLFEELLVLDLLDAHCFDYVSDWSRDGGTRSSYAVDDAAVLVAIRRAVAGIPDSHAHYLRLRALASAADEFISYHVPTWMNYAEFLFALVSMEVGWKRSLLANHGEQSRAERSRHAGEDDLAKAFRAAVLYRAGSDANLDSTLENYLNEEHSVVDDVSGTWVVTLRTSSSAQGAGAVELWRGNDRMRLDRFSPGALGLQHVATRSVGIWAFFIPFVDLAGGADQLQKLTVSVARKFLTSVVRESG